MSKSDPLKAFPQGEITNRLHALNRAKQALAQARTHDNQERYVQCFNWFRLAGIDVELVNDHFVVKREAGDQ